MKKVVLMALALGLSLDAPRDKCVHFREINGIAAAFHYLQKNYNPTASFFLWPSTGKYRYSVDNPTP